MDTLLLVNPYVIFEGCSLVLLANPYSGVGDDLKVIEDDKLLQKHGR